jgi:hypothetical protein
MNWLYGTMIVVAFTCLIMLSFIIYHIKKEQVGPVVYEVMAVKMKGDTITIEEGWEPFGIGTPANVIYVKRRKVNAEDN